MGLRPFHGHSARTVAKEGIYTLVSSTLRRKQTGAIAALTFLSHCPRQGDSWGTMPGAASLFL